MSFQKTTAMIMAAFLFTGMAAAETPDIPDPGITPDSPFYALEKISERLELAVAQAPIIGSEELEAKVRANHAAETLAEARAMAEKNNTAQVERLMDRYSENMNKSIESASSTNHTGLKQRLRTVTDNQNQVLEQLDDRVPEQARKGIQEAMENNRRNQDKLAGVPARKPAGPGTRKPEKPEQGTGSSADRGSAPITGRSTSPGKPGNDTAKDAQQGKNSGQNTSAGVSPGQETSRKQKENNPPGTDMDGKRSGAPDEQGSGSRP